MKKKVLLMGKSGSGKTSMRSIIFANYIARDTRALAATINIEHSNIRFLGNLSLNLWDCGGQVSFMENYFDSQRDHIFRNVEVLIYVIDVDNKDFEKDAQYFRSCMEAIQQNSEKAKIFVLLHKMDLLNEAQRERVYNSRHNQLASIALPLKITCFATSIWDETLYRAWSSIVYSMIPNIEQLTHHVNAFCQVCEADEVVLFERATFLVISHASAKSHQDAHRFEKISNIIKQFKLSCGKMQTQFSTMEIRNSEFDAFIHELTNNTFVMVIVSDKSIHPAATFINISSAREHFEKLLALNEE